MSIINYYIFSIYMTTPSTHVAPIYYAKYLDSHRCSSLLIHDDISGNETITTLTCDTLSRTTNSTNAARSTISATIQDIINGSNTLLLNGGTSGQVLVSRGNGITATWATFTPAFVSPFYNVSNFNNGSMTPLNTGTKTNYVCGVSVLVAIPASWNEYDMTITISHKFSLSTGCGEVFFYNKLYRSDTAPNNLDSLGNLPTGAIVLPTITSTDYLLGNLHNSTYTTDYNPNRTILIKGAQTQINPGNTKYISSWCKRTNAVIVGCAYSEHYIAVNCYRTA